MGIESRFGFGQFRSGDSLMAMEDRTTEYQIGQAVLRYLANSADGVATIAEIKAYLNATYPFTAVDRERSGTRPQEERWHQQVRNLMCHRRTSGNAICDGLLAHSPGRLAITPLGREYVERRYGVRPPTIVDGEG